MEKENAVKWSVKDIRRRVRRTVYTKGIKSYIVLIIMVFIFSFVGIIRTNASNEIHRLDMKIGVGAVERDDLFAILDYVEGTKIYKALPEFVSDVIVKPVIWSRLTTYSWIINLFSTNDEYMERNIGEVFAFIVIIVFLYKGVGSFFKKTLSVGFARAVMENRFQKNVQIRRMFAPFGDKKILHIIGVMGKYILVMFLWSLTIVGGFIKLFQYYFVPYLLAENPDITWKEAKTISSEMTKGYKWKMFLTLLSYFYLPLLSMLPFVDLFISLPVSYTLDAELYFTLRQRKDIDRSKFIEAAFDNAAYIDRIKAGEAKEDINPQYILPDFRIKGSDFDERDKYVITDFIAMFFVFCFVGWLWEVGLHIVKDHELVNRGYMYGPWLPIYGFGGVFIIAILNRFKNNKPKLFVSAMLLCGVLEYFTSFVLEFFKNMSYWDYHNMKVNLNGRVCLAGLIAFALGGFLGVYILGPLIKNLMAKLGRKKAIILCSILVILFIADAIICATVGPNTGKGVGKSYSMTELVYYDKLFLFS
ncbi:Protein of unknown function [Lachnospiraceae bacterium NE2001]|nr:Protein of unknown function [Lachnospiraceae bacterium NE2001]